jgi:hypothetical protein
VLREGGRESRDLPHQLSTGKSSHNRSGRSSLIPNSHDGPLMSTCQPRKHLRCFHSRNTRFHMVVKLPKCTRYKNFETLCDTSPRSQ